jgi:putative membrane protein
MQHKISTPLLAAIMSGSLAFAVSTASAADDYRTQQRGMQDTRADTRDFRADDRRTQRGVQQLTQQDRDFIDKALSMNAGTIELGRIAQQRTDDNDIRQLARTTQRNHREASQELASLSRDHRAEQARPTALDRWAIERLRKIEDDREFDAAYAQLIVARHRMAIEGLEMVSDDRRYSREVRNAAQEQLGALRQQLQLAQRVDQDVRQVAGFDNDD